jgi:hypothetical protein
MDLTIALSTGIQTWHDINAVQLPNSTAQCELIEISDCHEICITRFLLLRWGARAACAEVSTGSVEASKARLELRSHMAPEEPNGFRVYRKIN